MNEMKVSDLIICQCNSNEHQMIFRYDSDPSWKNVYISYYLQKESFWNRVKYIFGYQSVYGAFGEIILSANDNTIEKFENVVKHLKLVKEHEDKKIKEHQEKKEK